MESSYIQYEESQVTLSYSLTKNSFNMPQLNCHTKSFNHFCHVQSMTKHYLQTENTIMKEIL